MIRLLSLIASLFSGDRAVRESPQSSSGSLDGGPLGTVVNKSEDPPPIPETGVKSDEQTAEETNLGIPGSNPSSLGSQTWGAMKFSLTGPVEGQANWYAGNLDDGSPILANPSFTPDSWIAMQHPLIPEQLYLGNEGLVVRRVVGIPVSILGEPEGKFLEQISRLTLQLADLMLTLDRAELTISRFEPQQLVMTPQGLSFEFPPVLVTKSSRAYPGFYWFLGKWVYYLVTGQRLVDSVAPDYAHPDVRRPGMPQLIQQLLSNRAATFELDRVVSALHKLQPAQLPVFKWGAYSTIGLNPTRTANEDAYGFLHQQFEEDGASQSLLRVCVSDGMGGMEAGEVASRAAVMHFLSQSPTALEEETTQVQWTQQLVYQANTAVVDALEGKKGGCTMSAVVLWGDRYTVGHVGDTRAYLWTGQELKQLTRDHSLVAALVAAGQISEEEAGTHPDRNKILRSLGQQREMPDYYVDTLASVMPAPSAQLRVGQALILLTDGVWGEVGHAQLVEILRANPMHPQRAAQAMVDAAIKAGAPDNATAVIVYREGQEA